MAQWRRIGETDPFIAGMDRFGAFHNRAELNALRRTMPPEEKVGYAIDADDQGKKGLLVATDRRLVFVSAGLLRDSQRSLPYGALRNMELALTRDGAEVTLTIPEGVWKLKTVGRDASRNLAAAVKEALAKGPVSYKPVHGTDAAGVAQAEQERPATELEVRLERLDRMLQRGSITEPEYRIARRRLLEHHVGPAPRANPVRHPAMLSQPTGTPAPSPPRAAPVRAAPAPTREQVLNRPGATASAIPERAAGTPPPPPAPVPEAPAQPAAPANKETPSSDEPQRPRVWPPLSGKK